MLPKLSRPIVTNGIVGKVKKITLIIVVVANAIYFFGKCAPQFEVVGKWKITKATDYGNKLDVIVVKVY